MSLLDILHTGLTCVLCLLTNDANDAHRSCPRLLCIRLCSLYLLHTRPILYHLIVMTLPLAMRTFLTDNMILQQSRMTINDLNAM